MNAPTKLVPRIRTWLTRDSFEGQLEAFVDVWESAPVRFAHEGDEHESLGVTWFDQHGGIGRRVSRLPLAVALRLYATLPDDDRQCICVG